MHFLVLLFKKVLNFLLPFTKYSVEIVNIVFYVSVLCPRRNERCHSRKQGLGISST